MNKRDIPDLIDKATSLAGLLLKMVGRGNKGTALKILKSGKAEKKLREIIAAQGGNPKIKPENIPYAKYKFVVKSGCNGIISCISNKAVVSICKVAGTPKDRYAGILLNKKIGDKIKKNEPLFTIFAEKRQKLNEAVKLAKSSEVFTILDHKKKKMLIEKVK